VLNKPSRLYAGAVVAVIMIAAVYILQQGIAARIVRPCIPSADGILCYTQPTTLTGSAATAIAVSPDGQRLVSGSRRTLQLWDLETNRLEYSWQGHQDWITALAISPNGRTLASASLDQTVKLWSLETGNLLGTLKTARVTCLQFSPDGRSLAAGSRIIRWPDEAVSNEGVQVWDVATRRLSRRMGHGPVAVLAFSPDSKLLALGNQNTQIWRIKSRTRLRTFNSGNPTALMFSPDGQQLISASSKIKFWQIHSGALMHQMNSSAIDLALTSDGQTLATASGGTVNLWQFDTRKLLTTIRGSWYSGLSIDFGLDGEAIITSSSDGIKVWHAVQR
jgi:WD40 repeat protein